MDGYFTAPDQMDTFFECWIPELESWVTEEYASVGGNPTPNGYVYVPTGVTKDNLIGGCSWDAGDDIYFYCTLDGRVYLGEETAWFIYSELGDLVAVIGLAHELGHYLQQLSGAALSHRDIDVEQIPYENQADCVAGVFTDYVSSRGGLTAGDEEVEDDIIDLAQGMVWLQSFESEGDKRDHGTMDQRMRSFYTGYLGNQGLNACNVFITDFTVLPTTGVQIIAPPPPGPSEGPTTPAAPIPAPTLDPTALGADPTMNALAQSCYDGVMQACDDLFLDSSVIAGAGAYTSFGDTCAGRQPADTGVWCRDAFGGSAPSGPTSVPTSPTSPTSPTTTSAFSVSGRSVR